MDSAVEKETLRTLKHHAKPSCKKCYGRGYTGRNYLTKKYYPCSCALRSLAKERAKKAEEKEDATKGKDR